MSTAAPPPQDYRSLLASVDADGSRRWVGARIVGGRWRRWRQALALPLIAFYCAIPFAQVGGNPAFQIDLAARKLWLAGIAFWPQDLGYFVILVLLGIVGTLLAVATLGRVFCGWFCPHNVFLEMVFRPVEHLLLGGPGSPAKTAWWRAAIMWAVFALIAFGLANAGTAIFVGADAFRDYLVLDWAAHPVATGFWAVLFACILFNFGWFREQTCTIVCPYGRFQSAMLDPHTLVVAYDARRGEPRGHRPNAAPSFELRASGPQAVTGPAPPAPSTQPPAQRGDCIDCGLCVRVCPTGIDIRNGNQLECIHCAACIDACDGIMDKVGSPRGLIRYASEVLVAPLRQTAVPVREADPEGRDCVRAALPLALVNRHDVPLRARIALDDALDARVILPGPVELPPGGRITSTPIVYIPRGRFSGPPLDVEVRLLAEDGRLLGSAPVTVRTP